MPRTAARRSARDDDIEDIDAAENPWLAAGEPLPAGWHPGLPPPAPETRPEPGTAQPRRPVELPGLPVMAGILALVLVGAAAVAWLRSPAPTVTLRSPGVQSGDPALEMDARVELLARQAAALEAERAALAAEVQALEARRETAAASPHQERPGPIGSDPGSAPEPGADRESLEVLTAREPALPGPPVSAPPAVPARPRVFIHAPPSAQAAGRELASRLTEEGWRIADVRPIRASVSRTTVRYFFDADRQAAARLLGVIRGRTAAATAAPQAFTTYRPLPLSGTLEVWLSGRG